MVWAAIAGAGLQTLGGLLGGSKARKAAAEAARQRALMADRSWDASRFRPVGMTTRFGSSNFSFDDKGNLTSAGYDLSPDMQALQDGLLGRAMGQGTGFADQSLGAAQGLFNLGSGYMAQSPEAAASQWMRGQQSLLAPSRERSFANMMNQNYQQGTQGLSVGATGMRPNGMAGMSAENPLAAAYFNSIAQQDNQLAAQAMEQGREQVRFGTGLFGSGLGLASDGFRPMNTMLGLGDKLEQWGQQPYDMSTALGAQQAQINANASQNYSNIMNGSIQQQQQANSYSPWGTALSSIGRTVGGMSFPTAPTGAWNGPGMGMFSGAMSRDVGF